MTSNLKNILGYHFSSWLPYLSFFRLWFLNYQHQHYLFVCSAQKSSLLFNCLPTNHPKSQSPRKMKNNFSLQNVQGLCLKYPPKIINLYGLSDKDTIENQQPQGSAESQVNGLTLSFTNDKQLFFFSYDISKCFMTCVKLLCRPQ